MRQTALTLAVLGALLAAAVAVTVWAWLEIGEVEMSTHGLLALGLGIAATGLVGVGLMALLFFSHRRGYDDRAHESEVHRRRRKPYSEDD